MSKARLIITAVVVEGRSQAEVARSYGVSKGWVSKLLARYREVGEEAFEPRSRRPKSNPNATPPEAVDQIVAWRRRLSQAGLDAGPDTIAWHLWRTDRVRVSPATISRQLTKAGLVVAEPAKRPKSSYVRFEAALPNETWQADFTHYGLAGGVDSEILTWLDDHARYALRVTAHLRVTGPIVLASFRGSVATHGIPASTLTDNGTVFTTRHAGGKGGRNALENELRRLNVHQKNSRPNHPTTCGKVERFQQTLKNWLRAQPTQPATISELGDPARHLRRGIQHPAPAPLPTPARHPSRDLPRATQGPTRDQPRPRHPRPGPPRPHRRLRRRHPAPRRSTPSHRHRANPRPDPRHHARPGSQDPHHRRHHR